MEEDNNTKEKEREITVGMGRFEVRKKGYKLMCVGIGSCIAVAISDKINTVYGMAHIMLPYHKESFKTANPNKYADVCIPNTIREMLQEGAKKVNMIAMIAGGAHMFPSFYNKEKESINVKNANAVKEILANESIPIIKEDLGGNNGRTVVFDTEKDEFKVIIKTLGVEKIL